MANAITGTSSRGRGRGRGYGGNNGFRGGNSNGFRSFNNNNDGGGNYYNNRRIPSRDFEDELLRLIHSEFQINCSQCRSLEDIYLRVKADNDLFKYIRQDQDNLKRFILRYPNNFSFDAERPDIIIWNTENRLASLTDRKERMRAERRRWEKEYEEKAASEYYDPVHEETILRFIMALFKGSKDSWLRLDLVNRAVKQAFYADGDLLDYIGADMRSFLEKRDHLFRLHTEMILFQGSNFADVVYVLNEEIRENSYQGNNRMPFSRLHSTFVESTFITDDARREFAHFITDKRQFANFLASCSWVFELESDSTHVRSKRILPMLPMNKSLDKTLEEIVKQFALLHRQEDKLEECSQTTFDPDDLDEVYSGATGVGVKPKKPAGKKPGPSSSVVTDRSTANVATPIPNPFLKSSASVSSSVQRTSPASDVSANDKASENPFTKWR